MAVMFADHDYLYSLTLFILTPNVTAGFASQAMGKHLLSRPH